MIGLNMTGIQTKSIEQFFPCLFLYLISFINKTNTKWRFFFFILTPRAYQASCGSSSGWLQAGSLCHTEGTVPSLVDTDRIYTCRYHAASHTVQQLKIKHTCFYNVNYIM